MHLRSREWSGWARWAVTGAILFLCVEISTAQAVNATAADSVFAGAGDAVVWPQVRIAVRFLTKKGEEVPEMDAKDVRVFDNGVEVHEVRFERDATPLSICLMVDGSGSLSEKASLQVAAARTAIAAMQPGDEMAVVIFNKDGMLKQDFTGDREKLEQPLESLKFFGPSNLFDTLIATMDHVFAHSKYSSRVLLVLSDGGNNKSASDLHQTIDRLSVVDGPTVYSMRMQNKFEASEEQRLDFRNLQRLAEATGGEAVEIEPREIEVEKNVRTLMQKAHDRYTIVYKPAQQARDERQHKVEVRVGKIEGSTTKIRAVVREYHAPAK